MKSIMVVVNQRYMIPMFTMLCSLFTNMPEPLDIHMFSSDFEDEHFQMVDRFCNKWSEKTLYAYSMKGQNLDGLIRTEKLSVDIYYKLLGIDMLPESVHRILVMDLDMIVTRDISDVFDTDVEGIPFAACKDMYGYVYGDAENRKIQLGLPKEQTYINSGLLYYNLDYIRNCGGSKFLIDQTYSIADKLKWPEQDLLNYLWGDKIRLLPWHIYNCPPIMYVMKNSDVQSGVFEPLYQSQIQTQDLIGYMDYTQAICDSAAIIHYVGESKPWDESRPQARTYEIFDRHYIEYLNKAIEYVEE